MPNRTIYVKDVDLPLFERVQEQLGESVSSMFAEFLRDRCANQTPKERSIVELLNRIRRARAAAKAEGHRLDHQFDLAEHHALKAQERLSSNEKEKADLNLYKAHADFALAERWAKECRASDVRIDELNVQS